MAPTPLPTPALTAGSLSEARALANRTALGIVGDYKPWVAQLGNGDLLIIAFAPSPGHSGGSVSAHLPQALGPSSPGRVC